MSVWVTNQNTLWWGHVLWLWGHGFWWWGHEFNDTAIAFNLKVYDHRFMNTIEATKGGPHQGHKWKIYGSGGTLSCLLEHCSYVSWITHLPRRQYDFRLRIHSRVIGITQCKNDWWGNFTIFIMWLFSWQYNTKIIWDSNDLKTGTFPVKWQ